MSPESRALSPPTWGLGGAQARILETPGGSLSLPCGRGPAPLGRVQFRSRDTQVSRTGAGLKEGLSRYQSNGTRGDTVLALS